MVSHIFFFFYLLSIIPVPSHSQLSPLFFFPTLAFQLSPPTARSIISHPFTSSISPQVVLIPVIQLPYS
jgi:hypothetical protein